MKKKLIAALSAAMLLSLCACGMSADTKSTSQMMDYTGSEEIAAAPAEAYDRAAYDGYSAAEYGGLSNSKLAAQTQNDDTLPDVDPEKIIYSADATVETTDFDGSLAKVAELVKHYGGWIESSSINGANYYNTARGNVSSRSASYTLRVPSSAFSEIMNSLSELGNVPYTYTYTENVTSRYYDTQARLTAYQTQEARLLEMMEMAETVEDVIRIEDKLTELRYSIESLQSTLKSWDRDVSYSTVSLNVEEVSEYTPESPAAGPGYGQRLANALKSGLREVGAFFSMLLLWLAAALPSIVLIGVIAAGTVLLIKRGRKKRAAKKAAQDTGNGSNEPDGK